MIPVRFTEKEIDQLLKMLILNLTSKKEIYTISLSLITKLKKAKKKYHSKYPIKKDKDGNWPKEE